MNNVCIATTFYATPVTVKVPIKVRGLPGHRLHLVAGRPGTTATIETIPVLPAGIITCKAFVPIGVATTMTPLMYTMVPAPKAHGTELMSVTGVPTPPMGATAPDEGVTINGIVGQAEGLR